MPPSQDFYHVPSLSKPSHLHRNHLLIYLLLLIFLIILIIDDKQTKHLINSFVQLFHIIVEGGKVGFDWAMWVGGVLGGWEG
jgi:hypothetical protein